MSEAVWAGMTLPEFLREWVRRVESGDRTFGPAHVVAIRDAIERLEAQLEISREQTIEVLRQAWRELEFECSPTADELQPIVFALAQEWGVTLKPHP